MNQYEEKTMEMNEEDLEAVNGGFVEWVILGAAAGVVGGVCTYNLRKIYNRATGTCSR